MINEYYANVKGYEDFYQVSNYGTVKSVTHYRKSRNGKEQIVRGKILSPSINSKTGYLTVSLCKYGKIKTHTVHKLVAEAFIPNPNHYVCINHINEDKTDNRVENLEWCSYQCNNTYNGKLEKLNKCKHKPIAQYDLKGNLIKKYESITSASKELNISINSISNCLRGLSHKCHGYIWKYEKE